MGAKNIIEVGWNVAEFTDQQKVIYEYTLKTFELLQKVDGYKIGLASNGWGEFKDKIAGLEQQLSKLEEENKKLAEGLKGTFKATKELTLEQAKANEQTKVNNASIREQAKDALGLNDAYKKLSKEYEAAARAAQNLIVTKGKDAQVTKEAIARAQQLGNQLKDADAQVLKYQRNVGNYQGSAKIIVEAFERARLKVAEVGRSFGPVSPEAKAARLEFDALDRITQNPQFLNISAKVGDTTAELKFFQKQLNVLEDAGQKNSDVYKEIQGRLAQLTDQLGDTRAEIKAMSSDTRAFDLFAGSVSFAADAMQTAAGASVLFGASEKDAAAATKTLTAVQSVANGIKGIATELTTKGTAANKAYNFVMKEVSIITNSASTATQRFNSIVKTAGIGLLIAGFVTLISKLDLFGTSTKEAISLADKLTESFENQKKALDDLAGDLDFQSKLQIEKLKQQGASDKAIFSAELKRKKEHLIELQDAESQARKKRGDAEQFYGNFVKAVNGKVNKETIEKAKAVSKVLDEEVAKRTAAVKKQEQEIALSEEQFITKQIENAKKKNKTGDKGKDAKSIADAEAKAIFDIQELELQRTIDFNKDIAEDEKQSYLKRLEAARNFFNAKQELITLKGDLDKQLGTKSLKELELVTEQTYDNLVRLEKEFGDLRQKIKADNAEKITKDEKEVQDALEKGIAERANKFFKSEEDRTKKINEEGDKRAKKEEELSKKRAELQKQLISEISNLAFTALEARVEREKNALAELKRASDEYYSREIENINNSTLSEQDKAARLIQLKAEQEAKNQEFANRQKELDIKKAKFDKAQAIARIVQETAIALISSTLKPQLIPLIIAISAAQLAAVIAQPIPAYATGTDNHPGGDAIAGEGKHSELVQEPSGKSYVVDKATLLKNLPKGSKVIPLTTDVVNEAMYRSMMIGTANVLALSDSLQKHTGTDNSKVAEMQADKIVEAIEKNKVKHETTVNVINDFGWNIYISKSIFGKG